MYNLPDSASLFLKDLLTALKTRTNQEEVIISQQKLNEKHLAFSYCCLCSTITPWLEILFYCKKCLCNHSDNAIMLQATNRYADKGTKDGISLHCQY